MPRPGALLAGKTILVTRAAHQAGDLVREIRRHGGKAVVFPTIEIHPVRSWEACDRAIAQLSAYDGVIFTSANGVRYFFGRLTESNTSVDALRPRMICVVGEKTRQAVVDFGLNVTLMPPKFTASDLARTIAKDHLSGKRFLFPRGDLGDDSLTERLSLLGVTVDCVVVYETRRTRPENLETVRELLLGGSIEVLTFTSPSTFTNFVSFFSDEELAAIRPLTLVAAIGPATAAAINSCGMKVDISPAESSVESLVRSIAGYFHRGEIPDVGSRGIHLTPGRPT